MLQPRPHKHTVTSPHPLHSEPLLSWESLSWLTSNPNQWALTSSAHRAHWSLEVQVSQFRTVSLQSQAEEKHQYHHWTFVMEKDVCLSLDNWMLMVTFMYKHKKHLLNSRRYRNIKIDNSHNSSVTLTLTLTLTKLYRVISSVCILVQSRANL